MSLKEYKNKRNFDETPEPEGSAPKDSANNIFVVQCHEASHLHFDLRLQFGDTLKSWALPKGPSMNPSEQALAVFVEDHPLEYASFEGVIPEGNYGAGTVLIWDKGIYQERSNPPNEKLPEVMSNALLKGHITMILEGQRLKGEFALIRIKNSKNWLFVKKWDKYASTKMTSLPLTSIESARSFEDVKKDKKIWTGQPPPLPQETKHFYPILENSVKPKRSLTKGETFKLMIPAEKKQLIQQEGWRQDNWVSGIHCLLVVTNSKMVLTSKHGLDLSKKFSNILSAISCPISQGILDVIVDYQIFVVDVLCLEREVFTDQALSNRLDYVHRTLELFGGQLKGLEPWSPGTLCLQRHLGSPYHGGVQKCALIGTINSESNDRHEISKPLTPDTSIPAKNSESKITYNGPVRFTNLDKTLWKKEGIKKSDLIAYFQNIYEVIAPYLAGFPLSVVRFPNGVEAKGFFQKDFSGYHPRFLRREPIISRGSQKTIQYALCENLDSLLYLGNLSTIEINPWMSKVHNLDHPQIVYIDIDPNERPMKDIVTIARACKDVLEEVGAKFGLKSSGSKGFHIGIPLGGRYTYEEGRNFCLAICQVVVDRYPQLCTLERRPGHRGGRIYLDCLQNRRSQTIVAPYSPRPLPGAPVSVPVEWHELGDRFDQRDYNLRTTLTLLQNRGDSWAKLLLESNHLSDLVKNLPQKSD